jgi:multimeric flavodoxin WrbA
MDKGNTQLILSPYLEGMAGAGAEVELLYTKKLKISPCQGDYNCWLKTPGDCFQRDDMQILYPKLKDADIWVLATPVYVDGMSGPMKNLLDRMIPLSHPFFEIRDGHCRHALREGQKPGQVVLVANCGFWEMDNFDVLVAHMEAMCRNMDRRFAGAVLRPHGPAMKPMLKRGIPLDDIFEAARDAGRQLIADGEMSPATLGLVSRELLPLDVFVQQINQLFQRALDRAQARA